MTDNDRASQGAANMPGCTHVVQPVVAGKASIPERGCINAAMVAFFQGCQVADRNSHCLPQTAQATPFR